MSFLPSRVIIGSDHAGFELKQALLPLLAAQNLTIEDVSPTLIPSDDYPAIADTVSQKIAEADGQAWGVLVCGSGIGISIAANRHPEIRAAVVRDAEDARLARQDNHANVLTLGGRRTSPQALPDILNAWLNTEPSNEERHVRRVAQLNPSHAAH